MSISRLKYPESPRVHPIVMAQSKTALPVLARTAVQIAPEFFRRVSEDLKRPVEAVSHRPNYSGWPEKGLHAAWIGHSTVVLRLDGFTIVTDPVFSARIGLNMGPMTLGIKRLVEPASVAKEIPRADLILLSHAHMDHFDIPSLRRVESPETMVVTASNTSDLLRVNRYKDVRELRWNEQTRIGPVTVRAFEVNHWGARLRSDTFRSYNGYVIETDRLRVVFGGDTAYSDNFRSVRSSRAVNLAIMPIGAYDPWIKAHCTPEQALKMTDDAGAEFILPVHHKTFQLSREPLGEPYERLWTAVGSSTERVCLGEIGQEFHLSR